MMMTTSGRRKTTMAAMNVISISPFSKPLGDYTTGVSRSPLGSALRVVA
jgi:hypothetical protein